MVVTVVSRMGSLGRSPRGVKTSRRAARRRTSVEGGNRRVTHISQVMKTAVTAAETEWTRTGEAVVRPAPDQATALAISMSTGSTLLAPAFAARRRRKDCIGRTSERERVTC